MAVNIQSFHETKQYLPSEITLFNLLELEQNRMHNQCNAVRFKAVVQIFLIFYYLWPLKPKLFYKAAP